MHETNWLPGIVALLLGLVGGGFLWLRFGRGAKAAAARPHAASEEVADLRARKETLIARLRELQVELAAETDEAAASLLEAERLRAEREAAKVLQALQGAEARLAALPQVPLGAPPTTPPQPARGGEAREVGFFAARPVLRGFLWGAGSASFLFLSSYALLDFLPGGSSHIARPEGGPMTGGDSVMADSMRSGGAAAGAPAAGIPADDQPDPELDELRARSVNEPNNLEAKVELAQALVFRDRLVDAFSVIQEIQKVDPENAHALTYESVVRLAMGQGERAMELLEQAIAKEPSLTEAWVRRGLAAFELERYALAVESWEEALRQRPDGGPALRPVIAEAKARLAGGIEGTPTASGGEAAAASPPGGQAAGGAPMAQAPGAPAAQEGSGASAQSVSLTIDLDPSVKETIVPGSILFVYARPAGVKAGPPVAAKRVPASGFPLSLELGPEDTMMGQPFPAEVAIEARVDRDGDAMTRDPDDPSGSADNLIPGAAPTRIVLQ